MEFLIVCPLAFLAGFVDAIAGGGGLISFPAFLFAGLPVHAAIGTNKLSASMGTAVATIRYALSGYMVWPLAGVGIAMGLLGSWSGSNLALLTDDTAFKLIMLVILPFVAFHVLRTKDLSAQVDHPYSLVPSLVITGIIAGVVGIYDGFYGPGTGTFLMLLLTAIGHQDIRCAAGTTKAINIATNISGLVVFLVNGVVWLPLGLAAGAFSIAGNWIGAGHFTKKGSVITRPIMLVVIVLFAIKLVVDLITSL